MSAIASAADVGSVAPNFTLKDIHGKKVSLSSLKGKPVVLEWINPECSFVKAAHTKGSLVNAALRAKKSGAAWLAINSGAPGKQGHDIQKNRAFVKKFKLTYPILVDETGKTGKAYGATRTPHLFVINAKGILVYRGAVDNSPDGEGASPKGGKLVNYVDMALQDLAKGRPVKISTSKAYGCSVKYAD